MDSGGEWIVGIVEENGGGGCGVWRGLVLGVERVSMLGWRVEDGGS